MAGGATLTHCLVLVHKRAALRSVALKASLVLTEESQAATREHLLNICWRAFDRDPDVRVVTIRAADFAFEHRMVMWQLELCAHFQVTLEASFRRLTRVDDRMRRAATLHMQTAGAMTRFAADVLRILSFRH
jgi:hypothetical protein